jgi:hypothetical protein
MDTAELANLLDQWCIEGISLEQAIERLAYMNIPRGRPGARLKPSVLADAIGLVQFEVAARGAKKIAEQQAAPRVELEPVP